MGSELKSSGKPFAISKREVWEAYEQVKANNGAPGADGVTLEAFEQDLKRNLYKIWNRMSSGSYVPPPVAAVEIPKPHGDGIRVLGVPTVADRIAQTVVARRLEGKVEPIFHPDSYGYRPGRSALDAVAVCRQRCWKHDWVIDLDVQRFFDSVCWDLVVKAVQAHTDADTRWIVLYVKRWLAAPIQQPDGTLQQRDRGTPQGSAVSPVLANLFLHYAFDAWMAGKFPTIPFERYADDAVVHCVSQRQAAYVRRAITDRMERVGLRLHPDKTRIVYCKDDNRREAYATTSFTFLGYTFRARTARGRNGRRRLHRRTGLSLAELARMINPVVRGWMRYYGAFYRSALSTLLARINTYLVRWIRKKYKRLRAQKTARASWERVTRQYPSYFAHWAWVRNPLMIKMAGAE
jgi:group II intron reverse transcriptase/maturase